jgi:hypothetical protein
LHRLPTSSLAFLAPGLLHQLGNQLFLVQGCAQLLPEASTDIRASILAAAARGGETLRLLRALVGDPVPQRLPLAQALAPLVDVARVSLREHGHQLTVPASAAADATPVDAGVALAYTAQALCLLVGVVPAGVTGRFSVATGTAAAAALVTVRFEPAAGSLPFPLATAEIGARLQQDARCAGRAESPQHPSCRPLPTGLELRFPAGGGAAHQEA